MRAWPGFLAAPVLVLADQNVAYAILPFGCSHQAGALGHVVHAIFLVATLACAWHIWPRARPAIGHMRNDEGGSAQRADLMALLAFFMAIYCALTVVALWIPQWVLSPCYA